MLAKPLEGQSRVRGLPAVAGYHALAELADEITTPGPGQIRAMIIDCGNPVVSGPNGAALDEALASLELLVAVDLVQRESHRHAHWLIPAAHWLERSDLMPLVSQLQDQPFAQYGRQAVEPPARRAGGVGVLHRPGGGHAGSPVRLQGRQRVHQGQPEAGGAGRSGPAWPSRPSGSMPSWWPAAASSSSRTSRPPRTASCSAARSSAT